VPILVVVARIQIENLKIEAEKGFRGTLFDPELVDPNLEINFVNDAGANFYFLKIGNINSGIFNSIEREIV